MSSSPAGGRHLPVELALGGALAVVLPVVAWLRLDDTTRRTVWAEDGAVFLRERVDLGVGGSLLHPYAGYLHVGPRVLTDLAYGVVPVADFAVAMTALCCLTAGLVGATVFLCSGQVVGSVWSRVVLGALTVLVPAAPIEVLGNAANIHSYALWVVPWLLLARPDRWWLAAVLGLLTAAAALTEIQTLLFAPLVLWGIRDRYRWPAIGGLLVGLVAQVAVTLTHPRADGASVDLGWLDLVKGYLLNVVLAVWRPSVDGVGDAFVRHGWWLALAVVLPFVVLGLAMLALAVRPSWSGDSRPAGVDRPTLVLLGVLVVGTVAPLVASLLLNANPGYAYDSLSVDELAAARPLRYGVAPALFLLAVPVCAADVVARRGFRSRSGLRRGRPVAVALALAITSATLLLVGTHMAVDGTRRSEGPVWADQVRAAQRSCRAGGEAPPIRMAPNRKWLVALPCGLLD